MIVFVILGISADNIFVTYDAWRQSDSYPQFEGNLKKRMAYTIRRASKAILATSSTTAFAFLSNGFSSLMPISASGYFAAVIVPVNYVLIVFFFPAFIILYETHVKSIEQAISQCFYKSLSCFYCCKTYKKLRKIVKLMKSEKSRISQKHSKKDSLKASTPRKSEKSVEDPPASLRSTKDPRGTNDCVKSKVMALNETVDYVGTIHKQPGSLDT